MFGLSDVVMLAGSAFHTFCLQPKLPRVPRGDWFCPSCSQAATPPTAEGGGRFGVAGAQQQTRAGSSNAESALVTTAVRRVIQGMVDRVVLLTARHAAADFVSAVETQRSQPAGGRLRLLRSNSGVGGKKASQRQLKKKRRTGKDPLHGVWPALHRVQLPGALLACRQLIARSESDLRAPASLAMASAPTTGGEGGKAKTSECVALLPHVADTQWQWHSAVMEAQQLVDDWSETASKETDNCEKQQKSLQVCPRVT